MCKACSVFVAVVDDALQDERVDEWLINLVEQRICPHLPQSLQEECVEKAPTFVPAIIKWVEAISNTALCTEINVCGPAGLDNVVVEVGQDEDYECTVCKNLTAIVKKEAGRVQPDTLIAKIEQLKEQCEELQDEQMQDRCKQLVDKYGYLLVYFIEREKDGDVEKTCSDLRLCPAPNNLPVVDPIPARLVQKMVAYGASNDADKCQQCKDKAQDALEDLGNPDTQKDVASYLSRPCAWVPVYSAQCYAAFGNYTVEAMNAIASGLTAEEVCTNLAYCGDQEDTTHVLHTKEEVVKPVYVY
ncbi:unnamed protein product [Ostreobium quekettii]|uniref:Saposin B-type domain-containing protein n=1 Tax=Ostreobium quekettii TaxID=121088 RepID=A0A8S1IVA0_9CHLO|nr:unnamed protein product [Ostreobium quekettii]